MSEHSEQDKGGESILTEVIELASEYLSEDLNDKIEDAVKKAIAEILSKYGRNVQLNANTGAPVFVDESGKCEDGEGCNCQLDNGTPRVGKHLNTELFQQVLKSINEGEDVVEEDTISPTNPLTSSCHSYEEEEGESESKKQRRRREKQEKKEAKQKKKEEKKEAKALRKAEGKGKLDTLIEREDVVNEKLNKAVYAFLLNSPGVAQVIMGKQLTQTAIVNNDQKPIPVVIVTELNNSESNQTKKKRKQEEKKGRVTKEVEVKAEEVEKEETKEEVEGGEQEEEVVLEIVSEEAEEQQEDTEEDEEENGGVLQGKGSVDGSLIV